MKKIIVAVFLTIGVVGWGMYAYENNSQKLLKKQLMTDILKDVEFLWNKHISIRQEIESKNKARDFMAQEKYITDMQDTFVLKVEDMKNQTNAAMWRLEQTASEKMADVMQKSVLLEKQVEEYRMQIAGLIAKQDEQKLKLANLGNKIDENAQSTQRDNTKLVEALKKSYDGLLERQQSYEEKLQLFKDKISEYSVKQKDYEKQIKNYKNKIKELSANDSSKSLPGVTKSK